MPQQFIADSPEAKRHLEDSNEVVQRLMSFRRPYESRWGELYRHLMSKPIHRTYANGDPRSNVFSPFPYNNVNFIRNFVCDALFSMDPPFEVLPGGKADDMAAMKMQAVLGKLAVRDVKLRSIISEYVSGLATYGFYALDCGWDWDMDFIYEMVDQFVPPDASTDPRLIGQDPQTGQPLVIDPMTGQPLMQRVQQLKGIPRNRPKYTPLDIFDVAIDPDRAYVAKFFDKTVPQMERENQVAAAAGFDLYNPQALARLKNEVFSEGDTERTRNALVHICELWNATDGTFSLFTSPEDLTALSFKDQRYGHRTATYTGFRRTLASTASVLLGRGYNPYAHCKVPILYGNFTKLPGEVYGMGVIEPNFNATEMFNAAMSMIMDNWNIGVNPRYAYDATRDIDMTDLLQANQPAGLVGVYGNPSNVLMPLPTHTPDPGAYNVLPIFQQMIESTANISDAYQRGIGSTTGNKTATGISSVIAQSNKGVTQLVYQLCEDVIHPLLQMTASNIQQFLTDEIEVRITDDQPAIPKLNSQFLRISKEDIKGHFDFRIVGAAYMEDRFTLQANARMLTETAAKVAPQYLRPGTALEELYRISRIPYPSRFLRSEEEVQAEKQQQMMMAYLQAVTAAQQNEAEAAAAQAAEQSGPSRSSRRGGGGPQRPQPTVSEITGAVRNYAQMQGANAQGTNQPPMPQGGPSQ